MGVKVICVNEYILTCDKCGIEDVLHTGDNPRISSGERVFVHSLQTAIKAEEFHKSHGSYLCNECFLRRGVIDNLSEKGDR